MISLFLGDTATVLVSRLLEVSLRRYADMVAQVDQRVLAGGRPPPDAASSVFTTTRILTALLAASVGALLLYATRNGLGVSPDGVGYLLRAGAFADTGALYDSTYASSTHWPPGWAVTAGSLAALTGQPLEPLARALNVATYVAVFLLAAKSMAGAKQAVRPLHLAAALFFTLTYSVYWPATFVLTETAFLVLVMLSLLMLERFERTSRTSVLLAAAVLASCAMLYRYVGVVLLVPLIFAAARSRVTWSSRVRVAASTTAIVVLPTLVWAVSAPESSAPRHLSRRGMAGLDELKLSLEQLGVAVVRDSPNALLAGIAAIVLPILALVLLAFTREGASLRTLWANLERLSLMPWILFGSSYAVLIAAQRWWVGREILERYWPPYVVVALVLIVRCACDYFDRTTRRSLLAGLAVTSFLVLTALNLIQVLTTATSSASRGLGYNTVALQESTLVGDLRDSQAQTVFTDSTAAMEYLAPGKNTLGIFSNRFECEIVDLEPTRQEREPVVVAIFGRCATAAVKRELKAQLPGAEVTQDQDARLLVLQWEP